MENALRQVFSRLDSLEKGQEELKVEVTGLKGEVTGLKGEVTGLKGEVTGLKGEVAELKVTVNRIETVQNAIFEQTGALTESHVKMMAVLDEIRDTQKSIIEVLGEHDVQIRNLIRRPV